jgi:hypothetical protein
MTIITKISDTHSPLTLINLSIELYCYKQALVDAVDAGQEDTILMRGKGEDAKDNFTSHVLY